MAKDRPHGVRITSSRMTVTFDEEYRALQGAVVWTDRSTRDARLQVRGPDAADWLQGLLTQDVAALATGEGAAAVYLTPQGRMVADLIVLRRADDFLIECVAGVRETLLSRLDQFVIMEDVTVVDVTDDVGCLTVLGPGSPSRVAALTGLSAQALEALPEYGHLMVPASSSMVVGTRAFGVAGVDLIAPMATLEPWRDSLRADTPQASTTLLDVARIEAGRPRFGIDMHDDTIPLEAGLESRAIDFDKGCYVGQEVVIRILHRGKGRVARRLMWLEGAPATPDTPAWSPGAPVHLGQQVVGTLTSACWSPARGGWLAIAMLHRDAAVPGTTVSIGGTDATVAALP